MRSKVLNLLAFRYKSTNTDAEAGTKVQILTQKLVRRGSREPLFSRALLLALQEALEVRHRLLRLLLLLDPL